jgi:hypothetical protein
MDWIDLLQWPAFAASVAAAWLVGSPGERARFWGFWVFLASNCLWVAWALPEHAWALVALQVCLAVMNIRGLKKADSGGP